MRLETRTTRSPTAYACHVAEELLPRDVPQLKADMLPPLVPVEYLRHCFLVRSGSRATHPTVCVRNLEGKIDADRRFVMRGERVMHVTAPGHPERRIRLHASQGEVTA